QHLVVDEVAGAPPVVAFVAGELVADAEVVGAERSAEILVHDGLPTGRRRTCPARRPAVADRRRQVPRAPLSPRRSVRRARPARPATSCPVRCARSRATAAGRPDSSWWSGSWPSGCLTG